VWNYGLDDVCSTLPIAVNNKYTFHRGAENAGVENVAGTRMHGWRTRDTILTTLFYQKSTLI